MADPINLGHANRAQGFYGECVFQAITAAARLKIARQILEPDGIDFEVVQERIDRRPRCKRIEVQVKTRSRITRTQDGSLPVNLRRQGYHALNGRVGHELDIPRFLVVVSVPVHFSDYCGVTDSHIEFANLAYWHDLMTQPDLPDGQESVTVSVPGSNVLTPETLVALTCGDGEEATLWMSA